MISQMNSNYFSNEKENMLIICNNPVCKWQVHLYEVIWNTKHFQHIYIGLRVASFLDFTWYAKNLFSVPYLYWCINMSRLMILNSQETRYVY